MGDNSFKGGINRYALFSEGNLYIETENDFSLTDPIIEKMYPEPCIIICYSNLEIIQPDILVKEYNNFISLSYHTLDTTMLGDSYMNTKSKIYMIL